MLTGGEVGLLLGLRGRAIVGDRAYDSNDFLASLAAQGLRAVIHLRANRKVPRVLDETFAHRNVIERFFGRVRAFRCVATRYDKTAASYAALLLLASSVLELS